MNTYLTTEDQYPMYHCEKCGYFYRDAAGTEREGHRGQQTMVLEIVCASCKQKDAETGD